MSRYWLYYLLTPLLALPAETAPARRPSRLIFEATAFSTFGVTRSGTLPNSRTVAADHAVLPLGTRIRVSQAGGYSGIYTVRDTGSAVHGRHIDIYIPNTAAAKQFGKKTVRVTVLRWGNDKPVADPASPGPSLAQGRNRH